MEAALEAEESKVTRTQLELTQYKQEAEKRIADKDEELENLRYVCVIDVSVFQHLLCAYYLLLWFFFFFFSKNHARQLESLQASLETEVKSKSDLVGISRMPLLLGKTDIRSACGRRFLDRRLYWGLSFSRSISM